MSRLFQLGIHTCSMKMDSNHQMIDRSFLPTKQQVSTSESSTTHSLPQISYDREGCVQFPACSEYQKSCCYCFFFFFSTLRMFQLVLWHIPLNNSSISLILRGYLTSNQIIIMFCALSQTLYQTSRVPSSFLHMPPNKKMFCVLSKNQ